MGFKYFSKLYECQREHSAKYLKGKTVAVDAMGELHRALMGTSKVGQLTDKNGNPTNYISVLLGVIGKLYTVGAYQIWVFDSPIPHRLKYVINDRRAQRNKAQAELDTIRGVNKPTDVPKLVDVDISKLVIPDIAVEEKQDDLFYVPPNAYEPNTDQINKLEKKAFKITGEIIENVKRILNSFRIPYIMAPNGVEAEHIAAHLTQVGKADIVLTNDPDALLFGAKKVIMRNRKKKGKADEFLMYILSSILEEHQLDMEKFINIAIVLGCDFYCDKKNEDDDEDFRPYFSGISYGTVLKKYPALKRKGLFDDEDVEAARDAFLETPPPYEIINEDCMQNIKGHRSFSNSKLISEMVTWLVDDLGFNKETIVDRMRSIYDLPKIKYIKLV